MDKAKGGYIIGLAAIAEHVGVNDKTLRKAIAQKSFPAARAFGGSWMAHPDDIRRWLRKQIASRQ